jgi:hypothetical protein
VNTVQRTLVCAVLAALVAIVCGPVGVAMAEPPALVVDSPAGGSVGDSATPSFGGTSNDTVDDVALNVYAGTSVEAGALVQTLTTLLPPLDGSWAVEPTEPLDDGVYTAQATQTNAGAEVGTSEPPVTFTVDTVPPAVSLGAVASPSNDTTPSFSGNAGVAAGDVATVRLRIYYGESVSGGAVREVEATPSGAKWTAGPVESLGDATYTAQAEQIDEAGNVGVSSPVTFVVDTAAPTVLLDQPASPSNDVAPSFAGSASDSTPVTVQVYAGATATGSVVATAMATGTGGGWVSGDTTPDMSDGQYTAVATQVSSLGNPAGVSNPVTFVVDTASPAVSLDQPASPSNDVAPSFAGSASDSTPVTVDIYAGATATGSVVATATATGTGGGWVSGDVSPALSSGRHTYTAVATQVSSLGNPAGVSNPVTFVVDTAAPTVSLDQPASPSNDVAPSFAGSASDSTPVTVQVYAGATATGSVVATATATGTGGGWVSGDVSPALSSGRHTYTAVATQVSSLGNPAGVSNPVTFVVDTASPAVSLDQPASPSNDVAPSFAGSASDSTPVTVDIYAGATATGSVVATATATGTGGGWVSGKASPALSDGQYTAIASQESPTGNHVGETAPVTFTVDTVAPRVTLAPLAEGSSTTSGSELFHGTAGVAAGDLPGVTVRLFSGAAILDGQAPLQSIMVDATKGAWSATFAGLSVGVYTVRAEQSDAAGNTGSSLPATFSVVSPVPATVSAPPATPVAVAGLTSSPPPAPPVASFTWVPSSPMTGQSVALVSSSTDASSPITAFAWDLTGDGTFTAGGPVLDTSFSTPGNHVVRLRVTDADGLTSVATETVAVSSMPLVLMQPFPVVRIAGSDTHRGVKLSLLTVQAPVGARVSVTCGGSHCPRGSESRVVTASRSSSKPGGVLLAFGRFERSLRAGVILEIRVSKAGEIGKYTSFRIRRGKAPARVDACVGPSNPQPIPCPAS